jgi:hypothetical protein
MPLSSDTLTTDRTVTLTALSKTTTKLVRLIEHRLILVSKRWLCTNNHRLLLVWPWITNHSVLSSVTNFSYYVNLTIIKNIFMCGCYYNNYGNKKVGIYYGRVANDVAVCQVWRYCSTGRYSLCVHCAVFEMDLSYNLGYLSVIVTCHFMKGGSYATVTMIPHYINLHEIFRHCRPIRYIVYYILNGCPVVERPVEMWWHTRRNQISNLAKRTSPFKSTGRQFSLLAAEMSNLQ